MVGIATKVIPDFGIPELKVLVITLQEYYGYEQCGEKRELALRELITILSQTSVPSDSYLHYKVARTGNFFQIMLHQHSYLSYIPKVR